MSNSKNTIYYSACEKIDEFEYYYLYKVMTSSDGLVPSIMNKTDIMKEGKKKLLEAKKNDISFFRKENIKNNIRLYRLKYKTEHEHQQLSNLNEKRLYRISHIFKM